MLSLITHICFNESGYVALHTVMNIMAESGDKMTKNSVTRVFSY